MTLTSHFLNFMPLRRRLLRNSGSAKEDRLRSSLDSSVFGGLGLKSSDKQE